MTLAVRFVMPTPFGLLVGIDVGGELPTIHPQEAALATTFGQRRRATFFAGRAVLREALARLGAPHDGPIGKNARGAPIVPDGLVASLSHKDDIAVALVARADRTVTLGVDVETLASATSEIASQVLTARERDALSALSGEPHARAVLERFSMKEAFYKAIDPRVQRFVGFMEVELDPTASSYAFATTAYAPHTAPLEVRSHVIAVDDAIITLVHAQWPHG